MSLERMGDARAAPDLAVPMQRVADAANANDFDAEISFYAPDAVFDMPTKGSILEDWAGMYEEAEMELEEARDLGEGVTFALFVHRGRPRSSTAWVKFRYASVTTWRDGLA